MALQKVCFGLAAQHVGFTKYFLIFFFFLKLEGLEIPTAHGRNHTYTRFRIDRANKRPRFVFYRTQTQ